MINLVALVMLLSSLGLVTVLSSEPMLVKLAEEGESAFQAVKDATQGTFLKGEETPGTTKEMIVEGMTKPLETSLGWFRRKPLPKSEDHVASAREKAYEAREALDEANAQLRDATYGKAVDTGMYVGDKVSQSVGAIKNVAEAAEGWVEGRARTAYIGAADVKDKAYNAVATVGQKAGSTIGRTVSKAKDGVEDTYNSAAETLASAKETTHDMLRDAKESIYVVHDAMVENVQLAIDDSKGTGQATEKVKETGKLAKEGGQGILGKVKDAACYTAECLQARAQEAGSYLPLIGQGVGYVYSEEKVDPAKSMKERTNSASETARQTYDNARDTTGQYYEEGRNNVEDRYDPQREATREYYDEASRHYRRARDHYNRPRNYYKVRRGRSYRGPTSRYYGAAREDAREVYNQARYANQGIQDRAQDYHEGSRGYIPSRHQQSPRDYYGSLMQRGQDSGDEYYERKKFQPDDDLSEVVESMGWKRIGKVGKDHVSSSFPKEVVIGGVKYMWPQGKGQPPSDELHETLFHYMTESMRGAAHTVGEKLGFGKEKAKSQAYDTLRDGRSWSSQPFLEDDPDDDEDEEEEDEDSMFMRGAKNMRDEVKNVGQAFEEKLSKSGEYTNEARREFLRYNGGVNYRKARSLRSWKNVFLKKPVGFVLALIRALHLFTFSAMYGSAFWVTFVSGMILSKHIPRQQFGYVQSRIFPVYLRILVVGQSVLFLLHFLLHPWFSAERAERMQLLNFGLMIASTLVNTYVLEPRATRVMFERLKVEKEEGRGLENTTNQPDAKQMKEDQKQKINSINEQFKMLHGYSSALNLLSLGGLTCHLWHLANRLLI